MYMTRVHAEESTVAFTTLVSTTWQLGLLSGGLIGA